MNLSALPQLLANWFKGQGTALLEAGRDKAATPQDTFQSGTQYQGRVVENLANGRSLVQVAGQKLDMQLPRGTQAGDNISLTYLHNVPRPTFAVERPAVTPVQPVRLSNGAQQLTALAQLAKPVVTAGPPPTVPSPAQIADAGPVAARPILSSPLPLAMSAPTALPSPLSGAFATATALTGGAPVDATHAGMAAGSTTSNLAAIQGGTPENTAVLPQRLHQTLRESGMFYEAHLERWSRGTFELAELRREPQANFLGSGLEMAKAQNLTHMPEQAAQLAGRQLQMLEGAPFFWQGFAWPGQWLEWQVEEQAGGEGGEDEAPASWATELRLTLPRLGGVDARLSLVGSRLTVGLSATDSATAAALAAALSELEQALTAAGLQPAGLSVGPWDHAA